MTNNQADGLDEGDGRRSGRFPLYAADIARIAVFAGLIAALGAPGSFSLWGNAVPVTAQTLGVMLAGALLGAYRGTAACLVFLALVAAGLPITASHTGGLAVLSGPRGGFLIGWAVGALVIGLLTQWILPKYRLWQGLLINFLGGIVVIYAIGMPWQMWRSHLGFAKVWALDIAFLPGDLVKVVITTLVAAQVHRAYPTLVGRRRA